MGTTFIGDDHWAHITRTCRKAGPRFAAIAYLGPTAHQLLPLRRGDILVTNLDRDTLLARSTSPGAIRAFLAQGVRVYASPQLHAKVLATRDAAVIGSANASANSARVLREAIIITDTKTLVQNTRAFVRRLVATSDGEVDSAYLGVSATDMGFRPSSILGSWRPGRDRTRAVDPLSA